MPIPLALIPIGNFLKKVPLWVWLILAAGAGVYFYGEHKEESGYKQGRKEVQDKWNIAIERGKQLLKERKSVTTVIETKYVDRIKYIHEKGEAIERVREVFVPVDSGYLSGGFRLFYDAAIRGSVPDTTAIATASPVTVTDVADIHAINAKRCRIAYETVALWNEWADEQCKLNPNGCPPDG